MIRRITLENFMSHRHTVIEPGPGLTVLSGPNNCGKSAVVAALQVVCQNISGDFMVRHGAKECVVTIETEEGHEVQWRRKGKTVSYRVNGEDIHRLRGRVPDSAAEKLRLPLVETEKDPFDIHFGEQKQPIFLLADSPARRATFFASSSDAVKLLEMQALHRRNSQEAKTRLRDAEQQEQQLTARLEALAPVDGLEARLQRIEDQYHWLEHRQERIADLRRLCQQLARAEAQRCRWHDEATAASKLLPPPRLHPTAELAQRITHQQRASRERDRCRQLRSACDALAAPPALEPLEPLKDLLCEAKRVIEAIAHGRAVCRASEALCEPPVLAEVETLRSLIALLARTGKSLVLWSGHGKKLHALKSPPALEDTRSLAQLLSRLRGAALERRSLKGMQAALDACQPPPPPVEIDRLQAIIAQLRRCLTEQHQQAVTAESLVHLSFPPALIEAGDLPQLVARVKQAASQLDRRRETVWAATNELAVAEEELRAQAEQLGSCPLCGQAVSGEAMLATVCRHQEDQL